MDSADDDQSFHLDLPHLRVRGRWTPTAGERDVCRDIIRRVNHRVPSRDTDPRLRYTTMAMFFYDALDAVRAAPTGSLPTLPNGQLSPSSLANMVADACLRVGELVRMGGIAEYADDVARRYADEIEPEVLEFRRAVGTAGGGDATFWAIADPGEGPLWSVPTREMVAGHQRPRWWNRWRSR
jgi:hypothetical protein